MPLSSSQHFPAWRPSQRRVLVRSVNQSSNFEDSCPLTLGNSWSKDVVRVPISMWHIRCVCVCLHSCVHGFLFRLWVVGFGWSVKVRCFSLSVSCINSAMCVGGWQVPSGWVGPEVARIDLITQARDGKCQVPHYTHQRIHFLIWP